MNNDLARAEKWTTFLASHLDIPRAALLRKHFDAGIITRLCACGCNSYDLTVDAPTDAEPLMPASGNRGCALQLAFYTNEPIEPSRTVEIMVFVDERGSLAGIDVDYCGNSAPMPVEPVLIEPPFHIYGKLLAVHGKGFGS